MSGLKFLQNSYKNVENELKKEIFELEKKYKPLFQPILDSRYEIVAGNREPSSEECATKLNIQSECCSASQVEDVTDCGAQPVDAEKKSSTSLKGVPGFWLTVLKNCDDISPLIKSADEDALRSLQDIRCTFPLTFKRSDDDEVENVGFTIQFVFSENDWFSNEILEKSFIFDTTSDEAINGISFTESSFLFATGTTIDWKDGKSLVEKSFSKVQRNKKTGATRNVSEMVPCESFFMFFDTIRLPTESEYDEMDEEVASKIEQQICEDFYLGDLLKNNIIPYAFDWFTGEAHSMHEEDEYSYDEEDEDEEDEDDEDEEDETPRKPHHKSMSSVSGSSASQKECKTQ